VLSGGGYFFKQAHISQLKRYVRHSSWFQSIRIATKTLNAYETMHMIYKEQIRNVAKKDAFSQKKFVEIYLE
jgi:transposase-like protein